MFFDPINEEVIHVGQLNRLARNALEALPHFWISGEISNLTIASSGHYYFSLKDETAQVRCVMFRHRIALLGFRLQDGLHIELKGVTTLYEARGEFQITVESIRRSGIGRLFEAFERLKNQLKSEGLFDPERKKLIPPQPRAIGVVTSLSAAALRDVVTTLRRRMPSIEIIVYPCQVQGFLAAEQIARAIETANKRREVETLIVCRGGGSIEDLWAFNEEVVARAIYRSKLPIVSGVGHETDFTIADFVADARGATPTAAAELASPNKLALQQQVDLIKRHLDRALSRLIMDKSQRLDFSAKRLKHPKDQLNLQKKQLEHMHQKLKLIIKQKFKETHKQLLTFENRLKQSQPRIDYPTLHLAELVKRLDQSKQTYFHSQKMQLSKLDAKLCALNPEAVLARGYAIVQNTEGQVMRDAQRLRHGERLAIHLAKGQVDALVDIPKNKQPELPF